MENKVYFIGLKCSAAELAEKVSLINAVPGEDELAYMGFWGNVCIIEYNGNTDTYTIKENIFGDYAFHTCYGAVTFIHYCNDNNIQFAEGPLGQSFTSYAMAHLAVVRWAADIAYTRNLWNNLVEGYDIRTYSYL